MTQIAIQLDKDQLADLRRTLRDVPNGVDRAMKSAVRRTTAQVKTRVLKAITSDLNIKRKDIDADKGGHRFGGVRSRVRGDSGYVSVTGRRVPLFRFGAKQTKRGVTYRVRKAGGRTMVRSSFVARMGSGHEGVFKRLGKSRLPIQELFGPSIPQVALTSPSLQSNMEIDAAEMLRANIASQVDRLLARRRASGGRRG